MGLFDFFSDAVDFVKDMVTTPEPRFLKGDIVHIVPLDAELDIYDELGKRNLTSHQKSLYWEVMEDDCIYVTMHQVGYKGTKVKVLNFYLTKVQQQSSPSNSNDKKSESKQSENFSSNSVTQSPQTPPYSSTNLKIGDLVKFNSTASTYYNAKSGAKISLSSKEKSTVWKVTQFDISSNKIVHLISLSDNSIKIKARVSDLTISNIVNQSSNSVTPSPQTQLYSSTNLKIGDLVKFNSTASTYYNAKSGAKISLSSKEKSTVWKVTQFDISSNKIVHLISLSDNSIKIKARVSDLTISNIVNQSSNSVTPSPQTQLYSSTNLKIGDLVKFNSTASTYYDAKSGAKIPISSKEKFTVWKVTQFDISNNKIVHLMSLSDNNIKIKARVSNLTISDIVNQSSNSVTLSAGEEKHMAYNDNYNGYQFTALGLSGSGKTCFMAGMYYKMTGGVGGYTLKADDDDSVSLTAYYEQMTNAQSGADRFPGGTNQSSDYSFELQYGYKTLEKFRWVDYAGGTLKSKNNGDAEEYQQLKNDIARSEVLYIFVDGGLFVDDDVAFALSDSEKIEILTDIVMDNCSRQINHFLSGYTSERKKLPPIAIIVTKYDLAVKALGKADNSENMEMLYKVIQRAFNPLFPDPSMYTGDEGHTSMVGIIPVSLGSKISENNYTGKLRPINMHMPAYVGIWFMLKSKDNQDTSVKKLSDEIEDSGIKFWLDGKTGKFSTLAEGYLKKIREGR